MLETRRLMTALAASAALAACGGDDGGTNPTPAIAISLSANTISVTQGSTGSVTVSLTRSGGFTGDVSLTVEGLPSGVTYTATPASLGSAVSSSVITIGAGGTATPATTNLTVRATGTGVTAQTATLALTVVAAPTPSFSLAAAPTTVTVSQGGNGTSTITLTRTGGFTGNVALAAEGLPNGVTATFNPTSFTGTATTSTVTFAAAANATTGNANVTIRGTATGQTDKTVTIALTVNAAATGNYTLAMNPAALTVQQGGNGTSTVNITRTGGFAGSVNLTASGLPNGVTAAFNPADATGNTSTLTLTASATAATGAATVTIKGTATGLADQTTTLALTVNAAPAGGYTLSLTPATLTIQQGANGTSTVNITRTNGFAGAVTLAATGLPNGVTATFNPAAPTGNTSTLTLSASATAATGQATVTVTGTATGLANQTTTLALTVNPAVGGSGNTTFEFCTVDQTPIWLAIQDGVNGTWTRVNVSASGTKYQFNITQPKAGVAYVTSTTSPGISSASRTLASRLSTEMKRELLLRNRSTRTGAYVARSLATSYDLTIVYGTQAELNGEGTASCLPGSGKTVNGTVAGVSAAQNQSATISLGPSSDDASTANTFTLRDVPDGALDLVAARSTTNAATFSTTVDKMIIRRGVNAANNSTLPVLDFGSSEAFDPVQGNLTIGNIGSDLAIVFSAYFTSAGSSSSGATIGGSFLPSGGPFKYYGVPASKQAAGDLHLAFALAFPSLTSTDQFRVAGLYFKDPTDRTVTLGAALPAQTVTAAATTPYVRFRATGPVPAEYGKLVEVDYTQSSVGRTANIALTEGYLAGAATYDVTIPDFTGVAGWDNNWGPKVGAETEWEVFTYGFTGIGLGSINPVEGATFKGAARSGTITP
jgi:hypothetical protein